jgi:hypothetical protein
MSDQRYIGKRIYFDRDSGYSDSDPLAFEVIEGEDVAEYQLNPIPHVSPSGRSHQNSDVSCPEMSGEKIAEALAGDAPWVRDGNEPPRQAVKVTARRDGVGDWIFSDAEGQVHRVDDQRNPICGQSLDRHVEKPERYDPYREIDIDETEEKSVYLISYQDVSCQNCLDRMES